jgi:hypothetical protein
LAGYNARAIPVSPWTIRISKTFRTAHHVADAVPEMLPSRAPCHRTSKCPGPVARGGVGRHAPTASTQNSSPRNRPLTPAAPGKARLRLVGSGGCCRAGRRRGLRCWRWLGGLSPFGPAVTMEPVRLESAPEGRAADAQGPRRFSQLPAVGVEGLDDSLFFPRGQCRCPS